MVHIRKIMIEEIRGRRFNYWLNLHDFYHNLGLLISKSGNANEVLNSEGEIRSIINLLKKD
ncbi:hypothetical protein Vsou_06520 [Vulcanisaeta souniana JCM 11219]|uniref:Uncharacterized protein n=1 Tax=Vulcanisaeta souniana JCM 11219 TaxID=1293586 RepID=A0A830E5S2_9CREN|nr:hypothetical protein Vsou_06520 [Vulcanisaeta souniana JCM 11219]GGI74122.1 hypothetical protein GCM10007112_08680 [Vulcanisaeta souniana JCM 11219]